MSYLPYEGLKQSASEDIGEAFGVESYLPYEGLKRIKRLKNGINQLDVQSYLPYEGLKPKQLVVECVVG